MNRILNLPEHTNKPIYIELKDEQTAKKFLIEVERAGFRFGNGAKPTERACSRVMGLNQGRQIFYPGIVGHIAFGCNAPSVIRLRLPESD